MAKLLIDSIFRHGDMLFLEINPDAFLDDATDGDVTSLASAGALLTGDAQVAARSLNRDLGGSIIEDEVDQLLWKQDGKIPREKNEQL